MDLLAQQRKWPPVAMSAVHDLAAVPHEVTIGQMAEFRQISDGGSPPCATLATLDTKVMRRVERYHRGIAATASPSATGAACEMLRAGGNAIDAAIAAAWALSVCEPSNSGLGGQTIALVRLASGESFVLDGHSRAPAAVSRDVVARPQQRSGYRATTIPTTPLVLETARQQFGRLGLDQVIRPAIQLAESGFAVSSLHRRQLVWCRTGLANSPSAAACFLKDGKPYEVGDLFRQPQLAATLHRLSCHGVDDFYHGHIARLIAEDMSRHGGLLVEGDLASIIRPMAREPWSTTYRSCRVLTAPPPAGGWQLLLGLRLVECLLAREEEFDAGRWYEIMGGVTRAVFREREQLTEGGEQFITDDGFHHLMSDERIGQFADKIASEIWRRENTGVRVSDAEEPGETTHVCTADAEGNVVSLTQSIQSLFGARVACEPCGFLYNNYLLTCPRDPHAHQLGAHCLPRSNAAPTLLLRATSDSAERPPIRRDVRPGLGMSCHNDYGTEPINHSEANRAAPSPIALGGAGSRRITSALLQTISHLVDRGSSLNAAVDAPRIHVKLSGKAWLERTDETQALVPQLAKHFRQVRMRSRHSYAMGCVQAVQIDDAGRMHGASDPRREGTAEVVVANVGEK